MLTGDVSFTDGALDSARGHSLNGVDTDARCELVSVLTALRLAHVHDRRMFQLLRRDIGRPCRNWHHENMEGHCDRIPLSEMPLLATLTWQEAEDATQSAIAWFMEIAGDKA